MATKFAMEADVLSVLGQKTTVESDDLGTLVRQLAEAAEPLEGTFNGSAKGAFNSFKTRTDEVAAQLNNALAGIVSSISGQNMAFMTASEDGASEHRTNESGASFEAADATKFTPQV